LVLGAVVSAPTVFSDELGYTKLAQSIGLDGRLALFDREGFSYSPLYPGLLAPIYALGASAPTAYTAIKIVNALLISLSIFPLYKIARFALPRDHSVLVAGVAVFAPLMSYAAFTMSENLAFPLCLMALWAMLEAVRTPGPRRDALLLVAILVATAARLQLVVLLPAALTAALLGAAARNDPGLGRRLARALTAHWLLFGVTAAALLAAGVRALAGGDVYSVLGRYAVVGRVGLPDPLRVLELGFHHLAGLDLAVGVIPFAGALVAAFVFLRARLPSRHVPFAAVAVSFTAWLLLEVAVDAALFDLPGGDRPRIHERFLIYAIPLFFIAAFACVRLGVSARDYLAAGALAAALPALIPFEKYVNVTNGVDTFALLPFGRASGDELVPVEHAPFAALWVGVTLALIYARLVRRSPRALALVLAVVLSVGSAFVWTQGRASSGYARSLVPAHADWVDRARPAGDVVLLAGSGADSARALLTAYYNLSIDRVYALCRLNFGADFGERRIAVDARGRLSDGGRLLDAPYAVVPARLRAQGRVVAENPQGRQLLVAPAHGRLTVAPGAAEEGCD